MEIFFLKIYNHFFAFLIFKITGTINIGGEFMTMSNIHCTVNNCHYWDTGNICHASEILVTNDKFGANQPDNVDATQAATLEATPANDCMDCACKTFVQKNSPNIQADGVTKQYSPTTGRAPQY